MVDTSAMLAELAAAGVTAWPESRESFATDAGYRIFVSFRSRPPTPVDITQDLTRFGEHRIIYEVERLTPSLRSAVQRDDRLIVLVTDTKSLWLDCVEHRPGSDAGPRPGRGRKPYVRYAIIRALLLDPRPRRQLDLAVETGSTQSVVSHALGGLSEQDVLRDRTGTTVRDWEALWETFVVGYPGAGGITTYWWHDSDLEEQATRMLRLAAEHDIDVRISGDLTARQVAPWRRPERAALYLGAGVDPSAAGFALGSAVDHTLSVTVPADRTVFATAVAHPVAPGHVDAVLAAYDVMRSGTTGDHEEAADRVRDVLFGRWQEAQR